MDHNNLYSILKTLDNLTPKVEPIAAAPQEKVYDKVESTGAVLEGLAAKLKEQFDAMEDVTTRKGNVTTHKAGGGKYGGTAGDPDEYGLKDLEKDQDDDAKAKPVKVKGSKKGRPPKAPEPQRTKINDPFGRGPKEIPKPKGGRVVKGESKVVEYKDRSGNILTEGAIKEIFTSLLSKLEGAEPGYDIGHALNDGDAREGEKIIRRTVNHDMEFHKLPHSMKEQLVDAAMEHFFDSDDHDYPHDMHNTQDPYDLDDPAPGINIDSVEPELQPGQDELTELAKLAGLTVQESPGGLMLDGKEVDKSSIELSNVDSHDYPDFVDAYISWAAFTDGTPLSDDELIQLETENEELVNELAHEQSQGAGDDAYDRYKDSQYEGLGEEYEDTDVVSVPDHANSPEVLVKDVDAIIHQGNDLNREKKQYAGKPKLGDNPMASEELDPIAALGEALMKQYQSIKIQRK